MRALVTDAHLRSVLAGIRGLGRAGHEVLAIGPRRTAAGLWSRYASGRVVAPAGDRQALLRRLAEMGERHGPLLAYPGQESTIDALLAGPMPPQVHLPYPDVEALTLLRDKGRLTALAGEAGLASPKTLVEATAGELRGWSPPSACVVKPVRPSGSLPTALVAESADELHAIVTGLPAGEPLLVQERARGPLTAIVLVLDKSGTAVARFEQVARRTWPPDAGVSTVAESVRLDEPLAARATHMLAGVGYAGLAQLQFVEVGNGRALIDVNPRFYGSLPLAIACGVNLPAAWHASATDGPVVDAGGYRTGVSFHWLEGEALRATRPSPRPLADLARVVLRPPSRPRVAAVWAADDPLASGLFGADLTARIVGRRVRR
ncbi:MAG: ATP-grasp domain-containing protein [Solirubrobacteraceae bacterium]